MKNIDSEIHVKGQSLYVDDIPLKHGTLFVHVFGSPVAHGKLKGLDLSEAEKSKGVVRIYTAKDIPGQNQIGSIIPDEPLLADEEVHYQGMPIAFVVAKTQSQARRAAKKIKVDIEKLPAVVCPREAQKSEQLLIPPRTFKLGDTDREWANCEHVVEGQADIGGQEHVYLETQGCYAYPMENGQLKVYSSTQAPSYVQVGICKVLGTSMHQIEVEVNRIGGGFGGKEDQATPWACMVAMASWDLQKPVKLVLSREDDMVMTGKRHPYAFDYKIGLDRNFKIKAYEVVMYQNAGASSDVSPAVMERSLFHGGSSYYIPNAKITVYSCKTNLPPNTAFRGFGAPQAIFCIEAAIFKAAQSLGVDQSIIQQKNLLSEGDEFPYGQIAERVEAGKCWVTAHEKFNVQAMRQEVEDFNARNTVFKKGLSTFPLCFGISFTKTSLNQGRSLVHIFHDGSVSISTGVIEMGQGVNTKIIQVAEDILSVSRSRLKIISTNTTRVANASPTAASSGADLNGGATKLACKALRQRLLQCAAKCLKADETRLTLKDEFVYDDGKKTSLDWKSLVFQAYQDRVCLSETGHYATPIIYFDKTREKGHPFAYHVYGTAITVVKLDCLRGSYTVEKVKVIHDFGSSMNLDIDMGQVEGAIVQGIGLNTIEELYYNEDGKNVYNNMSSYKVPDIYFIPKDLEIIPLDSEPAQLAIMGSKAVGEPPFLYGIGTFFAVMKAIKAFNANAKLKMSSPITFQKTLLSLYENFKV